MKAARDDGSPGAEVLITAQAEEYLRANYGKDFNEVLERSGIEGHVLTRSVCRFVCFDLLVKRTSLSSDKKTLSQTIKQLDSPPDIQKTADYIRHVIRATRAEEFRLLPGLLQKFVEQRHASEFADYKRDYKRATSTLDAANPELESLIRMMKESKAGTPMWEEITSLINGTVEALTASYNSKEFQGKVLYDVPTLKMRISRMKKSK